MHDNEKEMSWQNGTYQAPWLGRNFFSVMLVLFILTFVGMVTAILLGAGSGF